MKKYTHYIAIALIFATPVLADAATLKILPGTRTFKINSAASMPARDGLLGAWGFDNADMNTDNVMDRSGNRLSGSLNNFSSITKVLGKAGQALVFDGVDDNVSFGDVAEATTTTLVAWVKPAVVKGGMKIVSKKMSGASSQYGIATAISNTDKFTSSFFSSGASSDVCESTGTEGTYGANQWYHVVATYDGDVCKIYVNAVDVTDLVSDLASGNITNTTSALRIGADGGASIAAGSYFNGVIDDVRMYGRAFSAVEVQNLYEKMLGSLRIRSTQVAR